MKLWKNTKTLDALDPQLTTHVVDASEAEIAIIGSKPIDLNALPRLKGIFKCGVGVDNVPFAECSERGIEVGLPSPETADVIFEETASFAASLIFRMLYSDVGSVESWSKRQRTMARKLKVLLIGRGNIGERVFSKLERTFDVRAYDIIDPARGDLKLLMSEADAVSLHIPLHEENRAFIDAEKLGWMKDGAVLVNTARGPIVDESALLRELEAKRLRAAFDVYWKEPYRGPLSELGEDRFFMTPHVASSSRDFTLGLLKDFRIFKDLVC